MLKKYRVSTNDGDDDNIETRSFMTAILQRKAFSNSVVNVGMDFIRHLCYWYVNKREHMNNAALQFSFLGMVGLVTLDIEFSLLLLILSL